MPLTGEAKSAYMREYHREHREKEKLEKETKEFVATLPDRSPVSGEVLTPAELFKVYQGVPLVDEEDATKKKEAKKVIKVAGRTLEDKEITFDAWLARRKELRSNLWDLAHVMRGEWNEKAHKPLAEFFVKKDNSKLPVNYTQDQMLQCLLEQCSQHDRLLLYPRAFRKSTMNILDVANWIINFPDIIVLVITATKSLGRKFIKELRHYFSVKDYNNPTVFQCYFPEFCIEEGSGDAKEFLCPMAHLGLPNPTVSYSSMESSTAGVRCDILKFDDAVDEQNYKTVDSRTAILDMYDAASELLVRPYGFCDLVGTRYTDGSIGDNPEGRAASPTDTRIADLYGEVLKRNDESDAKDLKYLCGQAFTVLPHAQGKNLRDLVESDVELLYPDGPGLFSVLRSKLLKNENFFRAQQLNEPVAKLDNDVYINNFTEDNIRSACIDSSLVPAIGKKFVFVDTANSIRKAADYSAMVAFLIEERENDDPVAWLLSARYGHWTSSVLCQQIVSFSKKWEPDCTFIEELPTTTDLFKKQIQVEKLTQGTQDFYVSWFKPDSQPKAKETRIKSLELLLTSNRLRIVIGPGSDAAIWLDELKKQLIGYTGHKSNKNAKSGRKDDLPDAAAYVYKVMPMARRTPEDKRLEQELQAQVQMKKNYDVIFGGFPGSYPLNHGTSNDAEEVPDRGLFGIPRGPNY